MSSEEGIRQVNQPESALLICAEVIGHQVTDEGDFHV